MKKRIYRKILQKLLSLYPKGLKGNALKRVKKLAGLICGMLRKKKCTMAAVGSGLPQQITAHSKEKACKNFLDNAWNDYSTHYLPYIKNFLPLFIANADTSEAIYFVIDGSQMGNHHVALMVSLVYKNRSIPICWVVRKGPKGHFTNEMHLELIEQVYEYFNAQLPQDKSIVLLGDGEFDSIELQAFCREVGWDYVFRTACNTLLYEQGEPFQAKDLAIAPQTDHLFIPNVAFTKKQFKNVNFLYWHDPKYDEAIPLISNLPEALDITAAYEKRYSIECLFKDLKSTSFNIHKTRLTSELAITNLIMIAAFAFTLLIKLATKYEYHEVRKYLHRLRPDRIVCSIFFYALELIDYFLDEDIEFDFYFSKISMNSP